MPPRWAKRLLNEPHEAFRRRPDVELADQRQLGLGAAEDRRAERHSPILIVFASTDLPEPGGATKMSIINGRIAAAGRIVGPDRPVWQPKQTPIPAPRARWCATTAAAAAPRRSAPATDCRSKRARARHGAHHAVEWIPGDPGRLAIAPALDPLRERGCAPAEFPALAGWRPGRERRAQLDRDVIVLLAHLTQRREGALKIAVRRKDRQERRSDLLERHAGLAATLEDEGGAPRQPVLA